MSAATVAEVPLDAEFVRNVPSDRDLTIYQQIVVEGKSQREVAKEHGLSQPRVNQIVQELTPWVADNLPGHAAHLTKAKQLGLVKWIVRERLDHLSGCATRAWHSSIREKEAVNRVRGGIVPSDTVNETITRPSYGKTQYLAAATRINLALAKFEGYTPGMQIADAPAAAPVADAGQEARPEPKQTAPTAEPMKKCLSPAEEFVAAWGQDESRPLATNHVLLGTSSRPGEPQGAPQTLSRRAQKRLSRERQRAAFLNEREGQNGRQDPERLLAPAG